KENQPICVALEQGDDVAVRHIQVNGVRAPMEFPGIGPFEQHLDLILRLDELSLGVVMHSGPNTILAAHVPQVIVELARPSQMLAHKRVVGTSRREGDQLSGTKALQELARLARRLLDLGVLRRIVSGSTEGERGDLNVSLRKLSFKLR